VIRRGFLLLFCASSSLAAQKTRASIGLPGFGERFPIEDVTVPFTIDAPAAKVAAAVQQAFGELKVPADMADSATGTYGTLRLKAQINFAGYRMSKLLDCGQNTTTGPNADSYRVTIVFLALLDAADATHTKLQVGFVAGAEPPAGGRASALQCGSTGVMEAKFVDLVNKHLK
jgi:hypothetical protein